MRNNSNNGANTGAIERESLSVAEWCAANSLSKAFFYKLPAHKRPKVVRLGRRVLITREAATEWRRRMEAQTAEGVA